MSETKIGKVVNVRVRKPTDEEVERNREQANKVLSQAGSNPKIMDRYAELTTGKFEELLALIQRYGLDTVGCFRQVWSESTGDGKECPIDPGLIGNAAMTVLNIVAVAYALTTMAREAGDNTFSQDEIDKLFAGLPSDTERGN